MKYFLPFENKISHFMRENYVDLEKEFLKHIYPLERYEKPRYIRKNGVLLYQGRIDLVPLKIARILLDDNELRAAGWTDETELYKFPFKKRYLEQYEKLVTWNKLLETFSDSIEQLFFNIAFPNATLSYHYGVTKHCWRAHVCLQENPGFKFVIEDESKGWVKGMDNAFVFDDGNLWHGIEYQDSGIETPRAVCIIDYKK